MLKNVCYTAICGIPYGGIPYASIICNKLQTPLVMFRKEQKKYGSKALCEGYIYNNMKLLLLEDTITTGGSIINSIKKIKTGYPTIEIKDVVIICDRRNNSYNKEMDNLNVYSLFNIHDIINVLFINQKINSRCFNNIYTFMYKDDTFGITTSLKKNNKNCVTKRLVNIILDKKTNLVFSADINDFFQLIKIVTMIGKYICILKIHCDTINDFTLEKGLILKKLSLELNFLLFEDRKFTDIGSVFKNQYTMGSYKISEWADIITVNTMSIGIYTTFADINKDYSKAILPVCDMSNEHLNSYDLHNRKNNMTKIVDKFKDHIVGIVTQKREEYMTNNNIFYFTPGISITSTHDNLDQTYRTPQKAILMDNCDLLIVGRDIYSNTNIIECARRYKIIGWNTLVKRF
jgi:uridine monophosphate synthetase